MAMAKFTVDTSAKLFIAKAGVTTFDVKVDLYSDAKEHWIADDGDRKFRFPFLDPVAGTTTTVGGQDIDPIAGTSIPTYVFLENGWRVRPQESDHTLGVTGGVLLVAGGGDPFVDTLGAFTVRINYQQPVQAIVVAGGGGGGGGSSPSVRASVVSDGNVPAAVKVEAWIERDGEPVTSGVTSATATLLDDLGAVVFGPVAMTVGAGGLCRLTQTGVSLSSVTNYIADVSITDVTGTVRAYQAVPTLAAVS